MSVSSIFKTIGIKSIVQLSTHLDGGQTVDYLLQLQCAVVGWGMTPRDHVQCCLDRLWGYGKEMETLGGGASQRKVRTLC